MRTLFSIFIAVTFFSFSSVTLGADRPEHLFKINPEQDLFTVATGGGEIVTCARVNIKGLARLVAGKAARKARFTRVFSKKIRRLRARLAASTKEKRKTIRRKIQGSLQQRAAQDALCMGGEYFSSSSFLSPASSSSSAGSNSSDEPVLGLARSVSQYGITWKFDKEYPVGQFINGDYFVVGPLTVAAVSPAPRRVAGQLRNGSMINPPGGSNNQAFDERAAQFNASLIVDFPVVLIPNESLVSSISLNDDELVYDKKLRTAAVLTVVEAPIPSLKYFRPPYVAHTKPFHPISTVRKELLPSLTPPPSAPPLSNLIDRLQRVWLDHVSGWNGKTIFPTENMDGYGREIATTIGEAAGLLLLDEASVGDKSYLAQLLIQNGLDYYYALKAGSYWPGNGGHASGRKYQILFAGFMLNDPGMLAIGALYPASSNSFGEDSQTLYITEEHVGLTLDVMISGPVINATSNTITVTGLPRLTKLGGNYIEIIGGPGAGQRRYMSSSDEPWGDTAHLPVTATLSEDWDMIPAPGSSIYQVIGFEAHHIGMPEWTGIDFASYPRRLNPSWFYPYRQCCNALAWHGSILAARVMGLKDAWNNDALFDYQDRYMQVSSPTGAHPGWRTQSKFSEDMWDTYREQFGCIYNGLNEAAHSRIYSCSGELFDCSTIASCSSYGGNEMACSDDPCNLGCARGC